MGIRLTLLGRPSAHAGDGRTDLPPHRTIAVLAYLAYRGGWVARDDLVYLLWPDAPEVKARRNLRQTLLKVRRMDLARDLESEPARLRWAVPTDVAEFRAAVAAQRWERAAALYRGALLAGFAPRRAPEFERWLAFERRELHQLWREAALARADRFAASDRHAEAAGLLERLRRSDPLDEPVVRRHLRELVASGNGAAALRSYRRFAAMLRDELGAEPDRATWALVEPIERRESDAPPSDRATAHAIVYEDGDERGPAPRSRHNVPHDPTPFIGRRAESAALAARLLDPDHRLLTLLGPGGIGKTRLAQEVARRCAGDFADGAWFVPLEDVRAATGIVSAVGDALGLERSGSADPEATLLEHLRTRTLLLVLDNVEHLLGESAPFTAVLENAPGVTILATSRMRLGLRAEAVFDLGGLPVPDAGADPATARGADALRLFERVAANVRAAAIDDPEEVAAAARICRLVEGVPLALQLAASWTRILPVAEIADEIDRTLDLPAAPARDVPARHRSLRATFDHSWKLLTDEERAALRRLSVFEGGFTRAAAAEVAAVELPRLLALVDTSLLRVGTGGRFSWHPLVQQFVQREAESEPDERAAAEAAHARYYARFVAARSGALQSPRGGEAVAEIDADFANIRTAWRWAVRRAEAEPVELALPGLERYCRQRLRLAEGRALFASARRAFAAGDHGGLLRGRLLRAEGLMASIQGAAGEAERRLRASVACFRELGAARDLLLALRYLGTRLGLSSGRSEEGRAVQEEMLALARALGDREAEGMALNNLSFHAVTTAEAERLLAESVAVLRAADEARSLSMALESLAVQLLFRSGRYRDAATTVAEMMTSVRQAQDRYPAPLAAAAALSTAAALNLASGDLAEAEALARRSLAASEELDPRSAAEFRAEATDVLGRSAWARGDRGAAAAFAAESRAAAEAFGLDAQRARALELEARLALAASEHDRAETLCRVGLEALEPIETNSHPWDMHTAVSLLRCHADVALAQERLDGAAERFGRALETALRFDCRRGALDAIGGAAVLLVKRGERERGAALLAFVAHHPASADDTRRDAHRAAQRLDLAADAARVRGAVTAPVRVVVEELLDAVVGRA